MITIPLLYILGLLPSRESIQYASICSFSRLTHIQCGQDSEESWLLEDQSFEKLGEMMQKNYGKLLGLYDELPMLLNI